MKLTGDEKSISPVVACTVANHPHLNAWICLASAAIGSWHSFFWSLWQCEYNSYLWRYFCIQCAVKFFSFLSHTRISQYTYPRQETIFFSTGKGEREWARAEHHTNPARDQPRAPERRRECRGEGTGPQFGRETANRSGSPNSSSHPAVQSHSYFCACMRAHTVSRLSQSSSFAGFVVRRSQAEAGAATSTAPVPEEWMGPWHTWSDPTAGTTAAWLQVNGLDQAARCNRVSLPASALTFVWLTAGPTDVTAHPGQNREQFSAWFSGFKSGWDFIRPAAACSTQGFSPVRWLYIKSLTLVAFSSFLSHLRGSFRYPKLAHFTKCTQTRHRPIASVTPTLRADNLSITHFSQLHI